MTRSILAAAALATLLALPAPSRADVGASLSLGGGVLNLTETNGDSPALAFRATAELTPFFQAWIFRLEVGVEMELVPNRVFALRPGVKVFLPLTFYVLGAYGLGNLAGKGELTHSLILGLGKEFSIVDFFGILLEATGEVQLAPAAGTPINLMGRAGVYLRF